MLRSSVLSVATVLSTFGIGPLEAATVAQNFGSNSAGNLGTFGAFGQTFSTTFAGELDAISIYLRELPSATVDATSIRLEVFDTVSGLPGASLGEVTRNDISLSSSEQMFDFDFSSSFISLLNNTTYAFAINVLTPQGATSVIANLSNQSNPAPDYLGGEALGLLSSSGWSVLGSGGSDFKFAVSATPTAVPVPASLPLLAAGLGGLMVLRRRRNKQRN